MPNCLLTPTGREKLTPTVKGEFSYLFFGSKVKILLNYPRFSQSQVRAVPVLRFKRERKAVLHFRPGSGSGYLVDNFSFLVKRKGCLDLF